jgi:hypothetical protein
MNDSNGNQVPSQRIGISLDDLFSDVSIAERQKHNMAVLKTKLAISAGYHVVYDDATKTSTVTLPDGSVETINFQ